MRFVFLNVERQIRLFRKLIITGLCFALLLTGKISLAAESSHKCKVDLLLPKIAGEESVAQPISVKVFKLPDNQRIILFPDSIPKRMQTRLREVILLDTQFLENYSPGKMVVTDYILPTNITLAVIRIPFELTITLENNNWSSEFVGETAILIPKLNQRDLKTLDLFRDNALAAAKVGYQSVTALGAQVSIKSVIVLTLNAPENP